MIKSNIATKLLAFAIAVPFMQGAEPGNELRVTSELPDIPGEPHIVVQGAVKVAEGFDVVPGIPSTGGIRVAQGVAVDDEVHEKALLWRGESTPHVLRRPYKAIDQAELKTLKWAPEHGENLFFNINGSSELSKGPWLGVHVAEVSDLVASQLGLTPGTGLAVEHIVPESPAAKAGLQQHDILTKLDDQTLVNAQQLVVLVRAKKDGESVKLTFLRGGKEQSAKAKITERSGGPNINLEWTLQENSDDEDVVVEVGTDPVVINRRIAEKMNSIEKGALASAMAKGKVSKLKQGMHTSLFFVENSNLVLSDDTGTYNLRNIDGKKRLVVLNPEGDTIYKGDLETEKSIEELPEGIREKVKEMTGQNNTDHLMRFYKKVEKDTADHTTPSEVLVEEKVIITPDIKY